MQTIIRILKKGAKTIWDYKFSIICFVCLFFMTVLPANYFSRFSILNILSFFLLINLFSKIKYPLIPILILAIPIAFDAYFAFRYHLRVPVGIMASIFETNTAEAVSMSKDFMLLGLVAFIVSIAILYLSAREFRNCRLPWKLSLSGILIYWILFIPATTYYKIKTTPGMYEHYKQLPVITIQAAISEHFPIMYGDLATIAAYKDEMGKLKKYKDTQRVLPSDIAKIEEKETPNTIFFIIGESSYRKHYSLYGYDTKTTPFLDSLSQAQKMYYYEAIAPAAITRDALRISLSFATTSNAEPFFTQKNIIDLANDAGYETVWISNQDMVGAFDSYIGFLSAGAKYSYHEKSVVRHDINLVPVMQKMLDTSKKQLFIIHMIGSHMHYSEHYDETDIEAIPEVGDNFQYDRTIHHTDRMLGAVYNMMKDTPSSLLYFFSDHGEIVNKGHGLVNEGVAQFQIPLLIANNTTVPTDSIVTKYRDPKSGLLSASSNIFILSEIIGYDIPEEYIAIAHNDGNHIFHSDGKVYRYREIEEKFSAKE